MKKNKIYISGKITGLDPKEAEKKFNDAEIYLKELGYETVNPMTLPHNHGKTWSEYMREDLIAMLECSSIYMLDNYIDSKGSSVELRLASELGFNIFSEDVRHEYLKPTKIK